jgi:hypothetical protein
MGGLVRRILGWVRRGKREGRDQLTLEDGELCAVLDLIEEYPTMGGKKGAANLVHREAALIGSGSFIEAKRLLMKLCGQELAARRATPKPPPPFEPPQATEVNDVWSSDLFEINPWGKKFHVCVYQDLVSQKRLCLEPVEDTADQKFVAECFGIASEEAGGKTPSVCTKTDRGTQYGEAFRAALDGRCNHIRIPPGSPWFNGEVERGQRDNRDLVYKYLHRLKRPKPGRELEAVREACRLARIDLNEKVARPSLGGVTPEEVVRGTAPEVRRRNDAYKTRARADRRQRKPKNQRWKDRLTALLSLDDWSTMRLLRFLRLAKRDYRMVAG